jgi:uncharacterized protein YbjT (DUF2867 family)
VGFLIHQDNQTMPERARRVFVTGGTGFLGYRVVRALLEQGAEVTVLVPPDGEDKLGNLRGRVSCVQGDVWNPGSLRGRARGHQVVVHLVGGTRPDPKRGLTFRHLNFLSARNVAQMAVGDGVPHLVFLSASTSPFGVASGYLDSKREAEDYVRRTGLTWTIVRAPTLYAPGQRRNLLYLLIAILSYIPLLGLLIAGYRAMPVDLAARGIASLALSSDSIRDRLVSPRQLRSLGRAAEKQVMPESPLVLPPSGDGDSGLDEPPFGWLPPSDRE